jgi:DNA-binding NarL/FixJ family response regulator
VTVSAVDIEDAPLIVLSFPLVDCSAVQALTKSEVDIARTILVGMSNHEIAERRGRSDRTVANQVAAIFRKLGVRSRSELVAAIAPLPAEDGAIDPPCAPRAVILHAQLTLPPREALEAAALAWTALSVGERSIRFDANGRRYVAVRRLGRSLRASLLTLRECQVVTFAALGYSNKLIAFELAVSANTIGTHLMRALAKLERRSRVELVELLFSAAARHQSDYAVCERAV